ncbi:MAG: FkbM family methyltransferase [Deltaproteobacteria bacterium]|nr:FkbM family methyltransferase [Deltaproteobacteria bacterium]
MQDLIRKLFLYYRALRIKILNKDVILSLDGLRILVRNPRQAFIGRSLYLEGTWEQEVTQFVSSNVKPGMILLDVGADIGYYTLLFAKLIGQTGRVFSFEPIPKSKWYLDKNIEMNGLSNVSTFNFALFDKAAKACLEEPLTKSKINPFKEQLTGSDIVVEMKVFDDWKFDKGIAHVDLVKIDVEGAELNVLRGMTDTLQTNRPSLIIEVHPKQLEDFGFSPDDLSEFLIMLGYTIKPIDKLNLDLSAGNITVFCEHEPG